MLIAIPQACQTFQAIVMILPLLKLKDKLTLRQLGHSTSSFIIMLLASKLCSTTHNLLDVRSYLLIGSCDVIFILKMLGAPLVPFFQLAW